MIDMEFLLAIEKLPEVGVPILRRRDGVLNLLSSAEDLRRRADLIEDQALQAQNALKARVARLWSDEELTRAVKLKTRTAVQIMHSGAADGI